MSVKSNVLRNTFFSSVGIYIEYLLGLVCSVILTRTLGPNDFGVYTLFIWISASSIILINGGINTAQIKYISELNEKYGINHAKYVVRKLRKLQSIKTIIIVCLAIAAKPFLLDSLELEDYSKYYWIMVIALLFRGRYMFNISTLKGYQRFDLQAKVSLIVTPINLLLIIFAAIYFKNIDAFMYVYLITGIIFFFISRYICRDYNNCKDAITLDDKTNSRMNDYLRITSIMVILSYFISNELEIFMLGWLTSAKDAGMFRIAMTLSSSILLMIPGVFSAILLPLISSSLAEGNKVAKHRLFESTRILIILCIPLSVFVFSISSQLILAVYGPSYLEASIALSICIIGISIAKIADGSQSYLLSAEKQKVLLYILIISLSIKLLIGYYLIKNYALLGACITYVVSLTIAYVPRIYLACKYSGSNFPYMTLIKTIIISLLCLLPLYFISVDNIYLSLITLSMLFITIFIFLSIIFKLLESSDYATLNSQIVKIPFAIPKSFLSRITVWLQNYHKI